MQQQKCGWTANIMVCARFSQPVRPEFGPLADPKNTLEVRAATVAEQEAWIENAAGLSEDDYDRDDLWVFLLSEPDE